MKKTHNSKFNSGHISETPNRDKATKFKKKIYQLFFQTLTRRGRKYAQPQRNQKNQNNVLQKVRRSKVKNQNLQDQRLKISCAEENKTLPDFAPAKPLLLPSLLASSETFFSHTARLLRVQTLATFFPCSRVNI